MVLPSSNSSVVDAPSIALLGDRRQLVDDFPTTSPTISTLPIPAPEPVDIWKRLPKGNLQAKQTAHENPNQTAFCKWIFRLHNSILAFRPSRFGPNMIDFIQLPRAHWEFRMIHVFFPNSYNKASRCSKTMITAPEVVPPLKPKSPV